MSILERSYCYNTYQCIDWIKEQDPTIIVHDVYSNVAHNLTPDEVEEIFKGKPKFLKKRAK